MTPFNPEKKEVLLASEELGPAMDITDQEDANQYFENYVLWIWQQTPQMTLEKAKGVAKTNLAYYAAYFDNEVRTRVEKLFNCEHPFFGGIKEKGPPTPEAAFKLGLEWGEKLKNKSNERK
jgi:hypothetical protein